MSCVGVLYRWYFCLMQYLVFIIQTDSRVQFISWRQGLFVVEVFWGVIVDVCARCADIIFEICLCAHRALMQIIELCLLRGLKGLFMFELFCFSLYLFLRVCAGWAGRTYVGGATCIGCCETRAADAKKLSVGTGRQEHRQSPLGDVRGPGPSRPVRRRMNWLCCVVHLPC